MKNLKWIVIGIIVIAAAVYPFIEQAKRDKEQAKLDDATEQFEAALEQNNFAKAKGLCNDLPYEYRRRVTYAEIGYLINEGEFDMASQIATENDLPDAYYNKVAPNLVSIYTKYGAAKTIIALSSCVLPIRGQVWGERRFYPPGIDDEEWEDFNVKHNNNIERLMNYMKLSNDKESISKVAIFLTTEYPNGTKDVNAIKAKFGL